jgi:putative transposase
MAVLDGSKGLRRAVVDVFDHPVIARYQLHKIRNVRDQLPEKLRSVVTARMRRVYRAESALAAEAELTALAAELDRTHPGGAASLREGLDETLTMLRLGVPPALARTLRSTNAIESRSAFVVIADERQALARWADGAAQVRRRHGRGGQAVPPCQRPPAPADAARPAGTACRYRNAVTNRHNDTVTAA